MQDLKDLFDRIQGKSNKFDQIYNMNESQIRSLKNIYVKDYDLLDGLT